MTSILDEMMSRSGFLVVSGLYWARAADREWTRDEDEPEADFIARARRSAAEAGFAVLRIGGAIETHPTKAAPPPAQAPEAPAPVAVAPKAERLPSAALTRPAQADVKE